MQQGSSASTYLTTEELAHLIKYDARTIRNRLKDSVLLEGIHYIRPFGRRKILFIRAAIERDIGSYSFGGSGDRLTDAGAEVAPAHANASKQQAVRRSGADIPMATGGVCHV